MKLAPWVALAAIALLMSGSLWSKRHVSNELLQRLDFTGVDTLVVKSKARAEVHLGKFPGRMVDRFHDDIEASVMRNGNVLTITQENGWLEIEAPATLRRIEGVSAVEVAEGVRAQDVVIEGDDSLTWSGDVDRLRIVHHSDPSARCSCPGNADQTSGRVEVTDGRIGSLHVRSERGRVSLNDIEAIGHATLELGEHAEYDLGGMHGKPPEVTLIALPAATPAAPTTGAKPAPVEPLAEPPRPH
jgi:hypothetical protein